MSRIAVVILISILASAARAELPHTVWLEAETFSPLHGGNFPYQLPEKTTRGSWSVAGPGVAAAWTQGGESEWMSIAARADEADEIVAGRQSEAPAAGEYTLWVRYTDYREKKESFGVRVRQDGKTFTHVFGLEPVIDELDPMKLLWDWAFGWDHVQVRLAKGPFRIELYTTGPTEARRGVDCLCLTTDASYHPTGRQKPDSATRRVLRDIARQPPARLSPSAVSIDIPPAWKIAHGPPTFLWNVGDQWTDELKRGDDRIDAPFGVDVPLLKDFLSSQRGRDVAVYGDSLSGPAWHIDHYPAAFPAKSPFLEWVSRKPQSKFAILLNYGDPGWKAGADAPADKAATRRRLAEQGDRFIGYVAGESIAHDSIDGSILGERIKAAQTRGDVLAALRDAHTAAVVKKFSAYYGGEISASDAWAPLISCLSANMESHAHALCDWGTRRLGHENTGNSPTFARRLAFMRGAARQFKAGIVDYQSCNLGDASTIFSRQSSFYPASSRYIIDNQYDAWAGAGVNWVLKDYLLFHLAGADAFYHEEGNDIFFKPGGNAAGDDFPIQLSPRGRVTQAVMKLFSSHPRGTQFTPVAFLLDEAHGWSQERFVPGSFGLDPLQNPAVLTPGRHEAAIRGWFDVAYFPAPETQNEPASAIRQTFVNGIFGDIFDVIVNAPDRSAIAKTYPVLIAAGEVPLTKQWGAALRDYMEAGGTLVTCDGSFSGDGAAEFQLGAQPKQLSEASSFDWKPAGKKIESNVFRYRALPTANAHVLATASDASAIVTATSRGKGRLVQIAVPLGLGIDDCPAPMLALVMQHVTQGLLPIHVRGDVEWTLNRLDDGGWVICLLNNRGVIKPEHGVLPTDYAEAQDVTIAAEFKLRDAREWITDKPLTTSNNKDDLTRITLTVPAGCARIIEMQPR